MEEVQNSTQDLQDSVVQLVDIEDTSKLDFTEDYYKSAEKFKEEYPMFPEEYYEVLELHAQGVTPKQHKYLLNKERKKELKKQGKKTK